MSLVQDSISGFIGGVSQQPDKLMFPNQAKKLINLLPDPISGLTKRYPTQHIARLMDALTVHPYTHTIIKEDEKYKVYLTGETIRVFDLEGNEKNVYTLDNIDLNYIKTNNPIKDLTVTTIADYTFITNKTKVAKMLDDKYPNKYPKSALIFVKQGDYGTDYTIKVNGETVATKTTDKSDALDCKTNTITDTLFNAMKEKLGTTDWRFIKLNSSILIQNLKGTNFTISASDSNGDRNLFCFYKETDKITDLPLVAPNGFILKITGDDGDTSDDYYVQFYTSDNSTFGVGTWKECCSPDVKYKVDATTMPHILVREADGSFTFKTATWTNRRAGDEDTAKTPSIFGNTIQEVFTYKGRLGFIAGDKSIYSDTEDIFSLFKRTVMTSLDTDPIDVGSNSKMVLLKHSLPYNEELLLFSPTSIFTITSGDVFSNSTVGIDLTMDFPCSSLCKPIGVGSTALFTYDNGNYSGVYEIYIASTYTTSARCVTEQNPCYLPSGIYKMTGNVYNNIVCFLSHTDKKHIYTYNFYYTSEEKAQSAWGCWEFDGDVLGIEFVNTDLYLTIQYEDGIYLEKINCSPKQTETDVDFLFYLDRKLMLDTGVYSQTDKTTTFTLPYNITNTEKLLVVNKIGFPLTIIEAKDNQLIIKGNHTKVYVGYTYTSLWEMPYIYQRQSTNNGGVKVVEGLLMLKDINLTYTDSGYFKANVIPKYSTQQTSTYEFTGVVLGTISATLGKLAPYSGTFLIPVMSKNEDVKIEIINDSHLPSTFSSLVWLGDLKIRGN